MVLETLEEPLNTPPALNKKIAVLFTDIKESTAFYKAHGNLAGRGMIQKIDDMLFPVIKSYRGVIVKTIGDSIMAYFLSAKDALWASVTMQRKLATYNMENQDREHLLIRISMNYGEGIVEEKDVFGDVVNIAGKLLACCDARRIIVAEPFYRETKDTAQIKFIPHDIKDKKGSIPDVKVFFIDWEKPEEDGNNIVSFVPEDSTVLDKTPCFYCGTTKHAMSECPSKYIRKPTNYLERLGYMPIAGIQQLFRENLPDFITPLKRGGDKIRFDIILKEDKRDPLALCFFSFYETTEAFQIRSLEQLFLQDKTEKTGALMMGMDCLRVSKFDKARNWFEKAVKEKVDDYRHQAAMALLCLEQSKPEQALSFFKKALSMPVTKYQKRHIDFLISRLYEISGTLPYAQKEIESARTVFNDWNDAKYYLGVIFAKSGKIKQSLEIFRNLIRRSHRYYLMIMLSAELSAFKNEVIPFLNSEFEGIHTAAEISLNNIENIIQTYKKWFLKEDSDYNAALDLYRKASDNMKASSLSGLMDIPGIEENILSMLKHVLASRQTRLKKKIDGYGKILAAGSSYISRFPYKSILTKKNFKLIENFKKQIQAAEEQSEQFPLPTLQETNAMLDNLKGLSNKLNSSQDSLEFAKNMLFVIECCLKTTGFYLMVAAIIIIAFTSLLLLYQGYDSSFSSITKTDFIKFLKFGLWGGAVSGFVATTWWLRKNFNIMHRKIES